MHVPLGTLNLDNSIIMIRKLKSFHSVCPQGEALPFYGWYSNEGLVTSFNHLLREYKTSWGLAHSDME